MWCGNSAYLPCMPRAAAKMDEKAAQTQSATTASARTSYGSTATDVSWQLDAGEAGAGRTSSDGSATGFSALSSESDIHADGHGNSRTRDWREQIETGLGLSMQLELPSFRRIVTVEPVIFLYMFGTFLQLLTQQLFVYNYFASEKLRNTSFPFPNHSFCLTEDEVVNYTDNATANDVQAKAAHFTLYYMVINLLFAMFVTTIYGALSDRFGRKPTLILAGLGAVLQGIVTVLLIYFNMNVYWLILAGLISGLSGGYATILAASFAYIADISSVRWRTLRIGLAESMIFAGGALGDGAGGYWFNKLNCYFLPPMLLFIASNFLLVLYVLILPESFDKSKRFKISERRNRKGLKFLLRGIAMFFGCVRHYSAWKLWAALIGLSILVLNLTGVVSIQNYFFIQHPLQWHANTTGLYEAISQVTHCIGLLVIFPVLVVLGAPDALIGLIGITASCAAQVFTGLVKLTWQMFLGECAWQGKAVCMHGCRIYQRIQHYYLP